MFKQKKFRQRVASTSSGDSYDDDAVGVVTETPSESSKASNVAIVVEASDVVGMKKKSAKKPVLVFDDNDDDDASEEETSFQIKKTKASKQMKKKMTQAQPVNFDAPVDTTVSVEVGSSSESSMYSAEAMASLRAKQSYATSALAGTVDVASDPDLLAVSNAVLNSVSSSGSSRYMAGTSSTGHGDRNNAAALEGMVWTGEDAEVMEELTDTQQAEQAFLAGCDGSAVGSSTTYAPESRSSFDSFQTEELEHLEHERERRRDLAALQQARQRNLADINTHKSTRLNMKTIAEKEEFVPLESNGDSNSSRGGGGGDKSSRMRSMGGGVEDLFERSSRDLSSSDRWETELLLRAGGKKLVSAVTGGCGAHSRIGNGIGNFGGDSNIDIGDDSEGGNDEGPSIQQVIARVIRARDGLVHAQEDQARRIQSLQQELSLTTVRRGDSEAALHQLSVSDDVFQRFRVYCSETVGMLRANELRVQEAMAQSFLVAVSTFSSQCREHRLQQQDDIVYRLLTSTDNNSTDSANSGIGSASKSVGTYSDLLKERYRASKRNSGNGNDSGSGEVTGSNMVSLLGYHFFSSAVVDVPDAASAEPTPEPQTDAFGRVLLAHQTANMTKSVLLSQLRVRESRRCLVANSNRSRTTANSDPNLVPPTAEENAVAMELEMEMQGQSFAGIGMKRGLGFGSAADSIGAVADADVGNADRSFAHVIAPFAPDDGIAQFRASIGPAVQACTDLVDDVDAEYLSCCHLCSAFAKFRNDPYWALRYENAYVSDSMRQVYAPLALFSLLQRVLLLPERKLGDNKADGEDITTTSVTDSDTNMDTCNELSDAAVDSTAWALTLLNYSNINKTESSAVPLSSDVRMLSSILKQMLVEWYQPLLMAVLESHAFLTHMQDSSDISVRDGNVIGFVVPPSLTPVLRIYSSSFLLELHSSVRFIARTMTLCNKTLPSSVRLEGERAVDGVATKLVQIYTTALNSICLPVLLSLTTVFLDANAGLLCPVKFYMQQAQNVTSFVNHLTAVAFVPPGSIFTAGLLNTLVHLLFNYLVQNKESICAALRLLDSSIGDHNGLPIPTQVPASSTVKKVKFVMSSTSYSSSVAPTSTSALGAIGVPIKEVLRGCQKEIITMLHTTCQSIAVGVGAVGAADVDPGYKSKVHSDSKTVQFECSKDINAVATNSTPTRMSILQLQRDSATLTTVQCQQIGLLADVTSAATSSNIPCAPEIIGQIVRLLDALN